MAFVGAGVEKQTDRVKAAEPGEHPQTRLLIRTHAVQVDSVRNEQTEQFQEPGTQNRSAVDGIQERVVSAISLVSDFGTGIDKCFDSRDIAFAESRPQLGRSR
jgi:hypothetical protein